MGGFFVFNYVSYCSSSTMDIDMFAALLIAVKFNLRQSPDITEPATPDDDTKLAPVEDNVYEVIKIPAPVVTNEAPVPEPAV